MDCIICRNWFSSVIHNGACPTCERAIKQLDLNMMPERIKELAKAEKNGRLVVLPCKVGEDLYTVITKRAKISTPEFSFVKRSSLTWNNMRRVLQDFGKTVFLTREEAEAALKRREAHEREGV